MAVMYLRHITTVHVSCLNIDSFYLTTMVAYFCHHLSVIYMSTSQITMSTCQKKINYYQKINLHVLIE